MSLADRYQWLFRKAPALTVSLDEDGYFLDASDAWLRRFGYTRDELRLLRPQDLGSPETARRVNEEYLPLLRRTGRPDNAPLDMTTQNGERGDLLAGATGERRADGE